MKRFVMMMITAVCILSALTVSAEFKAPAVYDGAGYLTEEQNEQLSQRLSSLREKYNFDVAFVSEETLSASDAEAAADDFYDYNGYGYGENCDGIMFYIAKEERLYHFSTCGSGLTVFNDNGLKYLEGEIVPYLKDGDYYAAVSTYADRAEELLEMAANGTPFDETQHSTTYILCVLAAALFLPLIIAYIKMNKKLSQMKTAVKENYASNYMKPGSMKLDFARDIFLYSTVMKTEKPKSDSSSSHTSSSGQTHGGRGGSF